MIFFAADGGMSKMSEDSGLAKLIRFLMTRLGPVFGGLALDLGDVITAGPIGMFAGWLGGPLVAAWIGALYQLRWRERIALMVISAIYYTLPFTEILPLATVTALLMTSSDARSVAEKRDVIDAEFNESEKEATSETA